MHGVAPGSVVFLLSPMLREQSFEVATRAAAAGFSVLIVDTLPAIPDDARTSDDGLAWRIRRVGRDRRLSMLRRAGVQSIAWAGPQTLDAVLQAMARQSTGPRRSRR